MHVVKVSGRVHLNHPSSVYAWVCMCEIRVEVQNTTVSVWERSCVLRRTKILRNKETSVECVTSGRIHFKAWLWGFGLILCPVMYFIFLWTRLFFTMGAKSFNKTEWTQSCIDVWWKQVKQTHAYDDLLNISWASRQFMAWAQNLESIESCLWTQISLLVVFVSVTLNMRKWHLLKMPNLNIL